MGTNRGRTTPLLRMLDNLSDLALVQVMNYILELLRHRGVTIRDWDDRERTVTFFKRIGARYYLLAPKNPGPEVKDRDATKQR